ncbi:MAG: chemotaxis protein CheX [Proteobacteria bacterium]|nr:chemotaxis protein CheX [Pseudomonadota bacterium]
MKVEYIQPFISATRKVLSTMAFMESNPKKPYLKTENEFLVNGDISAVIELSGECNGSIGISFTKNCILQIAYQMLGEEFSEINNDISDMVGEIVNMISGDARRELVKLGFNFSAGIPSMISGENHELKHSVQERIIVIPFKTESGDFSIETCFDSKKFLE